jgi:hypothetical protein
MRKLSRSGTALAWWILVLVVLDVVVANLYWPLVPGAGVLSLGGDPVTAEATEAVVFAPVLAAVLVVWAAPALGNRNPDARLLAWRRDRQIRSVLATAAYGGMAALSIFEGVRHFLAERAAYELLWLFFYIPFAVWNLLLRAACVDKATADEIESRAAQDAVPA